MGRTFNFTLKEFVDLKRSQCSGKEHFLYIVVWFVGQCMAVENYNYNALLGLV